MLLHVVDYHSFKLRFEVAHFEFTSLLKSVTLNAVTPESFLNLTRTNSKMAFKTRWFNCFVEAVELCAFLLPEASCSLEKKHSSS